MQLTETIYEVTVRFDKSSDGTFIPSSLIPQTSITFTSPYGYSACWDSIRRFEKRTFPDDKIATVVLNTGQRTYKLDY
jgi:hypothetical protein